MSDSGDKAPRGERFEDYPLTGIEYITAMVHFYRAEVARSTAWRQRLDATTNWAVLTTAGMLSLTLSTPESPHFVLLLTGLVLLAYLGIGARRFRYFAVYRARVRMLEENFLIPIVTRRLESPMSAWRESLARDLDLPKYKTTFWQAFGFRLRRNYVWIFAMISGGWFIKVATQPTLAETASAFWRRMRPGAVYGHHRLPVRYQLSRCLHRLAGAADGHVRAAVHLGAGNARHCRPHRAVGTRGGRPYPRLGCGRLGHLPRGVWVLAGSH